MTRTDSTRHFHIRWSESNVDWERFETRKEAEERAAQIALIGDTFTIEEFDYPCTRCAESTKTFAAKSR
jgi:hypothetical protein